MMLARRARLMAFSAPQALTDAKTSSQLEISALQAYPVREPVSRRSYTIIRLQTRGGLVGYGECAKVTAQELAQVLQAVRGKEVSQFETVRQQLKNAPAGLMAALNMAMLDAAGHIAPAGLMAALNMAMLDAAGRSVKAPVYQVLGGPTRNKCRALAPLEGTTDTELATFS